METNAERCSNARFTDSCCIKRIFELSVGILTTLLTQQCERDRIVPWIHLGNNLLSAKPCLLNNRKQAERINLRCRFAGIKNVQLQRIMPGYPKGVIAAKERAKRRRAYQKAQIEQGLRGIIRQLILLPKQHVDVEIMQRAQKLFNVIYQYIVKYHRVVYKAILNDSTWRELETLYNIPALSLQSDLE